MNDIPDCEVGFDLALALLEVRRVWTRGLDRGRTEFAHNESGPFEVLAEFRE